MVNCFMTWAAFNSITGMNIYLGKPVRIPDKPCRHLNACTETNTHPCHSANFLEQERHKSTELLFLCPSLGEDSRWLFEQTCITDFVKQKPWNLQWLQNWLWTQSAAIRSQIFQKKKKRSMLTSIDLAPRPKTPSSPALTFFNLKLKVTGVQ